MSGAVKLIRNEELTSVVEYAYAASAQSPARVVWTAGACPLDEHGATVAVGDHAGQAHQVMRNLATALRGAGAELTDIVQMRMYVVSDRQEDLVEVWKVVRSHMGEHDAPGTLLGVSVLGYEDQLVEVEAVAVTP
ncbi:hypothetical protein GCM10007079_19890 [Nocardiopsis terrae]|uniref:Enamine deaminase RidA (YjgF/YER057c/UK114 family) n=1 Tax=Nocardiopsis terrae TaxID=372655 RepID=A0ABR9HH88_9ACTN|nr:RidA family protein [Nocardiopsis terrae]MBE1458395.1 enamine deaminase RidA (YjgF/YER057c/UK114 family) [Nocardiopsis terrae]GHC80734.1 hypothetical protein GCM10007079_19890 [Nocardiopsis terrae]